MEVKELETGERLYMDGDCIQSVLPPESLFGFTYHALMIPPFKPSNMLMLGYGNGTVSGLTKKIWGADVKVTGVDRVSPHITIEGDRVLVMDAYKFVTEYAEKYDKFDYIAIDLYNGDRICKFICQKDFLKKLKEICSLRLAVNTNNMEDFQIVSCSLSAYFKPEIAKYIVGKNIVVFHKV